MFCRAFLELWKCLQASSQVLCCWSMKTLYFFYSKMGDCVYENGLMRNAIKYDDVEIIINTTLMFVLQTYPVLLFESYDIYSTNL